MKKNIIIISLLAFIFILFNSSNIFGVTFTYDNIEYTFNYDDIFTKSAYPLGNQSSYPFGDKTAADYPYYFIVPYFAYSSTDTNKYFYVYIFEEKYDIGWRTNRDSVSSSLLRNTFYWYKNGVTVDLTNKYRKVSFRIKSDNTLKLWDVEETAYVNADAYYTNDNVQNFNTLGYEVVSSNLDVYECILNDDGKWVLSDNAIYTTEKPPSIEVLCTYNDDNSSATLSASIINGTGNEKLYYCDDIILTIGKTIEDDSSSSSGIEHGGGGRQFGNFDKSLYNLYEKELVYTSNKIVDFRLYDSEDNLIDEFSYNISSILSTNNDFFRLNYDISKAGYVICEPVLDSMSISYYDIYLSIKIDNMYKEYFSLTVNGNLISPQDYENGFLVSSNSVIVGKYTGMGNAKVFFHFDIQNKSTGTFVKNYYYSFNMSNLVTILGESNNNNSFSNDTGFSSLTESSSLEDLINASKSTFSLFESIFNILPGWIWTFVGILLVVCIALRILGR